MTSKQQQEMLSKQQQQQQDEKIRRAKQNKQLEYELLASQLQTQLGNTQLHFAAYNGLSETIQVLCKQQQQQKSSSTATVNSIDVNAKNKVSL